MSAHASEPQAVRHSVEKAHVWINDVAAELGTKDGELAYRALRAVLHGLRDRLQVTEAAQLASQMPVFIRGVFYEGWTPGRKPETPRTIEGFLDRVGSEMLSGSETETSNAVAAVMRVLARHVSAGELEDVRRTLPDELESLLFATG